MSPYGQNAKNSVRANLEGDDADRFFILPIEQVADQRRAVSSCFVSLTPRPTETAEIVQH